MVVSANQEAQLTATGALSDAEAHATRLALQDAGIVDDTGAVSLSVTDEAVMEAIEDVDLGKSISVLAARRRSAPFANASSAAYTAISGNFLRIRSV